MINELVHLSKAMQQAGVSAQTWHRKYKPIPNVSEKAPCVRIVICAEHQVRVEAISTELGKQLRKFGSNQGTFPAWNLQPLYRITDKEQKNLLQRLLQGKGTPEPDLLRSWCTEKNWSPKFEKKYAQSMVAVPHEIASLLSGEHAWPVMTQFLAACAAFSDPETLFHALEDEVFHLLEQKVDGALALRILFHAGNDEKDAVADGGSLSVIMDSQQLIDSGWPVAGVGFTEDFNRRLLEADTQDVAQEGMIPDAFGHLFLPFEEPMPSVKLKGGFDVTLRTMFRGQPCQTRYGLIENASYPIAKEMRTELASALEWIGSEEHRNITWLNTDKNEVFFAYPHTLPPRPQAAVRMFKQVRTDGDQPRFEDEAKLFLSNFRGMRQADAASNADRIQLFIIRKIDKARTKVIYSHLTDPHSIEVRSRVWAAGKENLPPLAIVPPDVQVETVFPLDAADVLNRIWKQNGTLMPDSFHPYPHYHGMQLFFGAPEQAAHDLSVLVRNTEPVAPYIGRLLAIRGSELTQWQGMHMWKIRQAVSLMGFLLLEQRERKERYMQEFAYLYGQILKISDELHLMYCRAVRKGDIPPQLAGSSLYAAVADAPLRTFGLLGQRMNPYLIWAKTYQYRNVQEKNVESWRVGWLLRLYNEAADRMAAVMATRSSGHLTDAEKAQLFLGYLASFPKATDHAKLQSEEVVHHD